MYPENPRDEERREALRTLLLGLLAVSICGLVWYLETIWGVRGYG